MYECIHICMKACMYLIHPLCFTPLAQWITHSFIDLAEKNTLARQQE